MAAASWPREFVARAPGNLVADQPKFVWRSPDGITEGLQAKARYVFTNRGGTDVKILSVSSGGCATPTFRQSRIRPGESGFLDLVKLDEVADSLDIVESHSSEPNFEIQQADRNSAGRVKLVTIRLAANRSIVPGDYELTIRGNSDQRGVLPIHIRLRNPE